MTIYLEKSCSFGLLTLHFFRKCFFDLCVCFFPFGFEGWMWVFIVLIPDHGLSIYHAVKKYRNSSLAVFPQDNKLNKNLKIGLLRFTWNTENREIKLFENELQA